MFAWVESFAATPYGVWALFVISFAESSFFPIPPDVLLIALCLARPEQSLWFAFVCSVASVLGGMAGYGIGYYGGRPLVKRLFKPEKVRAVERLYERYNAWATGIAGLTPLPYKLFTISGGAFFDQLQDLRRRLDPGAEPAFLCRRRPDLRLWRRGPGARRQILQRAVDRLCRAPCRRLLVRYPTSSSAPTARMTEKTPWMTEKAPEMPERWIVSGRVQGVAYRYFTLEAANRLSLAGWVRNLVDGSVEVVAQGSDEDLAELRRRLADGPTLARVERIEETPAAAVDLPCPFEVRY